MKRYLLALGGVLNLLFAAFHVMFPWLFQWGSDLASLSSTNRSIPYTAHGVVILVLLAFAYISLFHWRALLETALGWAVATLICLVWLVRSAAEIVIFQIGQDGAWWRLALFLVAAAVYVPAVLAPRQVSLTRDGRVLQ